MPMISMQTPIAFSDPLPDAVDVVVIGAGIIGTACAYFLRRKGLQVLLCEKGRVAGEQSSRNWGWVRQQGRDAAELPIMMESNRIWRGLAKETGEADLGFTQCGCVYLAENDAQMARYAEWHELAKQHQLDTKILNASEIGALVPGVKGKWTGGLHTPSDGRGEAFVAVPALARATQRAGAQIVESCAVRTIETRDGRVSAVHTEHGRVVTNRVVLAAGAWSTYFASNAGLDLPQLTVRSTAARTRAMENAAELPNVSTPGFAIRRRADGGYNISTGDVAEHYLSPRSFKYAAKFLKLMRLTARDIRIKARPPAGYPGSWSAMSSWGADDITPFEQTRVLNPPPSELVRKRLIARLPQRVPQLANAGIEEIWAGMIDVTPDAVPYVCEAPTPEGLFIGTGLSGHGFGIGPAVGRILADLAAGHPSGHELSRFRFERFTDGSKIVPGPY